MENLQNFCGIGTNSLNIDLSEMGADEVEKVIRKLKNGKAAGVDGLQAGLLKHGGEVDRMVDQILQPNIGCTRAGAARLER
jgi:hypothetical protein